MTSSQRINPPRATPSAVPSSAPKAGSNEGADDFAAKLTHARSSSKTPAPSSPPPAKSSAAPEVANAAEEEQPESTEASGAAKGVKNARTPRDSKEAKRSDDRDEAATSSGQSTASTAAASNGTAPATAPADGDVAAQSTAVLSSDAGAAIADALNGGTGAGRRESRTSTTGIEASALAGTLAAQGAATAGAAQANQSASSVTGELRTSGAQSSSPGAEQTVLAVVTDALKAAQNAANPTDSNAADSTATNASTPQNVAPDAAANAALSQLNSAITDPSSLVRNAHNVSQHTLHTPVGAHGWHDELATRLSWMVDQRQSAATLRLSPENMGPLEVRIDVRENQVSVWFGATQADTRAAIESALPRLRELLQGQGLSLADAGVFQQSQRESSRNLHTPQGARFSDAEGATEISVAARVGLFDGYA